MCSPASKLWLLPCSVLVVMLMTSTSWSESRAMDIEEKKKILEALDGGGNSAVSHLSNVEKNILKATLALEDGQPNQALTYLISEDNGADPLVAMLEAEAHRQSAILAVDRAGDYARPMDAKKKQLEEANLSGGLKEADAKLKAFLDSVKGQQRTPLDILSVGSDIRSVFLVDKGRSRLFVYERDAQGDLKQVADEYVVTGAAEGDKRAEGDNRTPNGIYRFVDRLSGEKLESRYGPVAFPIDYPNALDALHHKDGSGIWMHGYAENVDRRPSRDTKGCFALPNSTLLAMAEHVQLGKSWVLIGRDFAFDVPDEKESLLQSVSRTITQWESDWSLLKTEAYLDHYHSHFRAGERDLKAWKAYKRRVNAGKEFVSLNFSNMTLMHDPSSWPEGEVVVAEFDQSYESNNYQDHSRKRLYLARASKVEPWKILIEESVEP
ncbi:MAG: hypothetical protein AUJ56_02935 [Zetaproteobacteria bacterium CG1_02_49_23]|nr:MAG: hypothetical protein AUJ56_02935 [Zetaproteobacteria bacterium CG1_02_49_23]